MGQKLPDPKDAPALHGRMFCRRRKRLPQTADLREYRSAVGASNMQAPGADDARARVDVLHCLGAVVALFFFVRLHEFTQTLMGSSRFAARLASARFRVDIRKDHNTYCAIQLY